MAELPKGTKVLFYDANGNEQTGTIEDVVERNPIRYRVLREGREHTEVVPENKIIETIL